MDFLYQSAQWIVVDLDVAFLQARSGDSVSNMEWALLVQPSAKVDRVMYQIMAGLKAIVNQPIPDAFNLATFAIKDNRPQLSIE